MVHLYYALLDNYIFLEETVRYLQLTNGDCSIYCKRLYYKKNKKSSIYFKLLGKANVYNTINNEKVKYNTGTHSVYPFGESIDIIIQSRACNIFWSASWCGSNSFKLTCTYTMSGTGTSPASGSYIESESESSVANPQWNQLPRFLSCSFKRDNITQFCNRTHRHSFKRALISFAKPKLRPFWSKQHANDLVYRYIHYRFPMNLVF